ncbi:MAG TPA: hypothetical protein VGQ42_03420 [Candidatus Dormibacteraeota bacterium]|jgi:hypothetical protein|nr:hypothetical protein [Candidatus Dormibacteraeota bacterium]
MASFHGATREQADHKRMRLTVDQQGGRIEPWLWGARGHAPTHVFSWSQVERIEPVVGRYMSGPGIRFVFREAVPALEGSPNAARWPAAKAPVFLCGSDRRYRAVLAAVPASLVKPEPTAIQAG